MKATVTTTKLFPPIWKGCLVKEQDGSVVCHRVWFKIILNPILRKLGYVIVTHLDQEKVTGYSLQTYPLLPPPLPNADELKRIKEQHQHEVTEYKFNKRLGIKSKKPKRPNFLAENSEPATADRGWDIPPMFTYSNAPTPSEGEGTPSAIQNATPTLFL